MIDNSTGNPGPQGWWMNEADSEEDKLAMERARTEMLTEAAPGRFCASTPGPVNQFFLDKVISAQKADGIESGFSFRHVEIAAFGAPLNWLAQLIGSCVASGGMRAWVARVLCEILILGQTEESFGVSITDKKNLAHFAPYNYRLGRAIINLNGNSDGSICSAHRQGMMEGGSLPCDTPGLVSDAFPEPQSEQTYRQWGANNTLTEKYKLIAQAFKLGTSDNISSPEKMTEATNRFEPQMICSNYAFRPDYQHPTWKYADGSPVWIYKRDTTTSWGHNMTIYGYATVGGKIYVMVKNSWGMKAHKNGDHFWIPIELYAQWIKQAESCSIGEIDLTDSKPPIWE